MNTVVSLLLLMVNSAYVHTTEKAIASCLLEHMNEISTLTVTSLCSLAHVSPQGLTRFCKDLGYRNFAEFRKFMTYTNEIRLGQMRVHFSETDEQAILERICSFMPDLDTEVFESSCRKANELIHTHKRIIILGGVYPQMLAMHYEEDMLMMGKTVFSIPVSQDITFVPQDNDVLFVISLTGRIYKFYPEYFLKQAENRTEMITLGNIDTVPPFTKDTCRIELPWLRDDETENAVLPLVLQYLKYTYGKTYGGF